MDANTGMSTELKVMVGSEMDTVVDMEKLKVTAGLEMDTAGSMGTGVDMDVGMDSKLAVRMRGNVSAVAGVEVGQELMWEWGPD